VSSQVQILKVVVASPGDVQAERDTLPGVVDELNRSTAADRHRRLEIKSWQTDAFPGFHVDGPQGLIDGVLKIEDCDVLIGIFWKRFGTPVRDAASGTEHEIMLAYEAWKRKGYPQIMLYFKTKGHTSQTSEEIQQWDRLLKFKNGLPAEGLWWSFKSSSEFEKLVRNHLNHLLRNSQIRSLAPSPNLSINILGTETYDYSRVTTVDFCIINESPKHVTLTDLSVEILRVDPIIEYSITSLGALFSPIKYEVHLEPRKSTTLITTQRFMYQPNERDDFQLELKSPPGFEYEIRISAQHRNILQKVTEQIFSESVVVRFPSSVVPNNQ
jgi:hypothetical protein